MRAMLRFGVLLLACFGLAWQIEAARAEYLVMEVGLRFPDRLGSVPMVKGERYPQAVLGHGIEYRVADFTGSIYVYDAGIPNIPDGTANEIVRTQFARARGEIVAFERQRNLPEPRLLSEQPLKVGSVEFLVANYSVVRDGVETTSLLAMTGYRRHFIKIRVGLPSPTVSGTGGARLVEEFMKNVARLLADAGAR
jgi:hypothetical protein